MSPGPIVFEKHRSQHATEGQFSRQLSPNNGLVNRHNRLSDVEWLRRCHARAWVRGWALAWTLLRPPANPANPAL